MLDANDFLNIIKKAAMDAVRASQPSNFCMGEVVNTSPLKISIEQKMTLGSAQLVLTKNVTDYKINVTIEQETKETTIHNGLKVGDKVVLIKEQGGQRYLILDKAVNT